MVKPRIAFLQFSVGGNLQACHAAVIEFCKLVSLGACSTDQASEMGGGTRTKKRKELAYDQKTGIRPTQNPIDPEDSISASSANCPASY